MHSGGLVNRVGPSKANKRSIIDTPNDGTKIFCVGPLVFVAFRQSLALYEFLKRIQCLLVYLVFLVQCLGSGLGHLDKASENKCEHRRWFDPQRGPVGTRAPPHGKGRRLLGSI